MTNKCFVMMPIKSALERDRWKKILDEIIRPAIHRYDNTIEVVRVDELPGVGNWLKKIIDQTHSSEVVIADLTTANPNVMWELGLRHGSSHSGTIMITQNLKDVPSDLLSYNVITYNEDGSDLETFIEKISSALTEIFDSSPKIDSPFFDHIDKSSGRSKDFKISFFVDDIRLPDDKIVLKKKVFNDSKPQMTENEHYSRHQIVSNLDGGFDPSEIAVYHDKLQIWAKQTEELAIKSWDSSRIRSLAIEMDIACKNLSDVQVDDVYIEITFDGDIEVYKELPDAVALPVLPRKPKHIHEKQNQHLLNHLLGKHQRDLFNIASNVAMFQEITTPRNLLVPRIGQYEGCWVEENIVSYHAERIRQHFERGGWEKFYIVPKQEFESASATVEIRAKNIRGFYKKSVEIKFQ